MSDVIENCTLCPRSCGARREKESGRGFCGMGSLPKVARAALHFWEEPCISGTRGSGAVFFSGCTLKCVFCQNYEISAKNFGKVISVEQLAAIYHTLEQQGAHNINLVNPTHFVPAIIESLQIYKPKIPIVYNCGGYEKPETLRSLEGLVDIYLPDFKYAPVPGTTGQSASFRYSGAADYFEAASTAVTEMARQTGVPVFNENGILQRGTLVRHLILPENTRTSMAVLDWLNANLPDKVLVSLMGQYLPCGKVLSDDTYKELNRRITKREYQKVQQYLFSLKIDGFVQELSSAKKDYIPAFNLEGIDVDI